MILNSFYSVFYMSVTVLWTLPILNQYDQYATQIGEVICPMSPTLAGLGFICRNIFEIQAFSHYFLKHV